MSHLLSRSCMYATKGQIKGHPLPLPLRHQDLAFSVTRHDRHRLLAGPRIGQDWMKASRSALIVSAWVVGMPCGKPWYVFSVLFRRSFADNGPESA